MSANELELKGIAHLQNGVLHGTKLLIFCTTAVLLPWLFVWVLHIVLYICVMCCVTYAGVSSSPGLSVILQKDYVGAA